MTTKFFTVSSGNVVDLSAVFEPIGDRVKTLAASNLIVNGTDLVDIFAPIGNYTPIAFDTNYFTVSAGNTLDLRYVFLPRLAFYTLVTTYGYIGATGTVQSSSVPINNLIPIRAFDIAPEPPYSPVEDYEFYYWEPSTDITDPNLSATTILMTSNKSVTAVYGLQRYDYVFSEIPDVGGNITVSPEPTGVPPKVLKTLTYNIDGIANSPDWSFGTWVGNVNDALTEPFNSITITENPTLVSAVFYPYLLIEVDPTTPYGTFAPEIGYKPYNEVTQISGIPNEGFIVTQFNINGSGAGDTNPYPLLMNEPKSVIIRFDPLLITSISEDILCTGANLVTLTRNPDLPAIPVDELTTVTVTWATLSAMKDIEWGITGVAATPQLLPEPQVGEYVQFEMPPNQVTITICAIKATTTTTTTTTTSTTTTTTSTTSTSTSTSTTYTTTTYTTTTNTSTTNTSTTNTSTTGTTNTTNTTTVYPAGTTPAPGGGAGGGEAVAVVISESSPLVCSVIAQKI